MLFKNTRQAVGDVVEVTRSMKLLSNGRKVKVSLTKKDQAEIDHVASLLCDPFAEYTQPDVRLQVQITADTFRGGLEGKLMNLKEWVQENEEAYSDYRVLRQAKKADTWEDI
jgi:hypothetical protein